jgi:hypothetical protein
MNKEEEFIVERLSKQAKLYWRIYLGSMVILLTWTIVCWYIHNSQLLVFVVFPFCISNIVLYLRQVTIKCIESWKIN